MSQFDDEQEGETSSDREPDSELLVGVLLFLAGCLPAVSVAKALLDGTDLASDGLTKTAALAGNVAGLVGPWPALLVSIAITVIGTLMVLGTLRREPMRFVGGSLVSGLGLTAIASAMAPGAGGRLGDGTGGALASVLGSWAGVLLGMAVIGAALWLAFIRESTPATKPELELEPDEALEPDAPAESEASAEPGPFDAASEDEDEDEDAEARPSVLAGVSAAASALATRLAGLPAALRERRATRSPQTSAPQNRPLLGRSVERHNRVAAKPRRQSEPQTLGAALVRDDVEGVSHDEADALAPDEKTLEYMENVWRRANTDQTQPEPIPPSPYPEDVRLKGEVPDGTQPFRPLGDGSAAENAHAAPTAPVIHPLTGAPAGIPGGPVARPIPNTLSHTDDLPQDIAPFDFVDELSDPEPLQDNTSNDPFGAAAPAQPLSDDDEEAIAAAVRREGASSEAPRTLPPGVQPLAPATPDGESAEIASVGDLLAEEEAPQAVDAPPAVDAGLTATGSFDDLALPPELTPPPPASWEVSYADSKEDDVPIADVDNAGHWARRDADESVAEAESEAAEVEPVEEEIEVEVEVEEIEAEEVEVEEEEAELEDEKEEEAELEEAEVDEEEEEFEYVDEDGNPIDPAELAEYETDEDEDEEDDDEDGEEEEDDEEAEYEEVDAEEEEEEGEEEEAELEEDEEEAEDESTDPAFEAESSDDEYEDADAESGEPSVVLEPQAPPEGTSRDASRVLEAGRIVVREGRVAVSLLQRELEMEFDAACELLDQLQAEGLIGPYKGGKKRDILLSGEEWEGRFVRS